MESKVHVIFSSEHLQYKVGSKQLKPTYKTEMWFCGSWSTPSAKQNRWNDEWRKVPEINKNHDF